MNMDFDSYKNAVKALPAGKRLPNAIYLHIDGIAVVGPELLGLLMNIQQSMDINPNGFNIIKFSFDEYKVSFLDYPDFDQDPHPALRQSLNIDVAAGSKKTLRYDNSENPPILHRKETFLPDGHPKISLFQELTEQEERLGLYENQTKIGFRKQWQDELGRKGISFDGHRIIQEESQFDDLNDAERLSVDRHKTAISRFALSRPVQTLLKNGVLAEGKTFFDYGCGLGDDIRALTEMGFETHGWDPVYRPEATKVKADVVNLGFVLNVIENQEERVAALKDAFEHAAEVLAVSVMIRTTSNMNLGTPLGDGYLSNRNTFQKFYEQAELGEYIEQVLHVSPVAVAPGVYLAFQSVQAKQAFLEKRSRRTIDWVAISSRIFANKPRSAGLGSGRRTRAMKRSIYEENKELIDAYWDKMLVLGRAPTADEFDQLEAIGELDLTHIKLRNLYVKMFGEESVEAGFLEKNKELLEDYWSVLAGLGRVPKEDEYERSKELLAIGLSPIKARNIYVRLNGEEALAEAYIEANKELLNDFWTTLISMGRVPKESEYERLADLRAVGLNIKKAYELFLERFGEETLQEAFEQRRCDLLVYLALSNFKEKVTFKDMDPKQQTDIRTFFGGHKNALDESKKLLYSVGNADVVEQLCDQVEFGLNDGHSLFIHSSLVGRLPPALRVYIGCAEILYGDMDNADIIKIHKRSGKLTLMVYDNFERRRFPTLKQRIKIKLRERDIDFFDYDNLERKQVIYNKDLYVDDAHPLRHAWRRTSEKIEKLIGPIVGYGPTLDELEEKLRESGYNMKLEPMR